MMDEITLKGILKSDMQELVVCLSHAWGGLEQVAATDAADLAGLGMNVRVLCLEGSPIHENLAKQKGVTLIPLDFRPRDYFDFKMRAELKRLIIEGVNVIHLHQPSLLGSVSPWLWAHRQVALFASRHIMSNHDKRDFFHRAIYRRLDALVVMSQTLKRNVVQTHPVKERQVRVVNLGIDFERFDPERVDPAKQRAQWGADVDTVVVGLVGRIDPAKGQDTFIKAAAGVLKFGEEAQQKKLKFVGVGEETLGRTSNYLQELQEMLVQFRLEKYFVFAGYQENIPEVMRSFDILVMPSRQEAFGLVAIEALAMGCPIVISRGGSADEIVGQQEFGLLVRPQDAFDLQQKLRYLLDNPEERQKMGQRGREHVLRHYDRKTRIRQHMELYERALRRRSRKL